MNLQKQFIVIEIAPCSVPKTKVATLPYIDLETCTEATKFVIENSFLPPEAEIDEKNIIVSEASDSDCDDDCDDESYGDKEGYYLTFTAGDVHYHVIVKDVPF